MVSSQLTSEELFEKLTTGRSAAERHSEPEGRVHHHLRLHQEELEAQNRELREAQVLLEHSRALYADLYDRAPVGFLTLDRHGWVCLANLTAASILGHHRDALVGAPFASAANLVDPIPFFRHLGHVRRTACTQSEELDSHAREGGRRLRLTTRALPQSATGSGAYDVILVDVTDAHMAQLAQDALAKERRARAAADANNHSKDQFFAMVSHELRTPLNVVLGWAEILRQDRADPALVERGISTILHGGRSLARLVDDMLDVSRVMSGKLRLELMGVKMDAVVRIALEGIRDAAAQKKIVLREAIATPCIAHGDAMRLGQVVTNLLSNAVKFSNEGGAIEVSLEHDGATLRLRIRDEGCGMDAADLPHIFEAFQQAPGSTVRSKGGLGLGLTIARHIVEAHRGTLHAHSDGRGRGATFTVELPVCAKESASRESPPSSADCGSPQTMRSARAP